MRTTLFAIVCLAIALETWAQIDTVALQRLQFQIDTLQNSTFLQQGMLGASVKNARTGIPILQYQSRKSLSPASTMKLLTTATAMSVLGDGFRFQTTLEHDGEIVNGVLKGNLYLRGTGDPTLGSGRFSGFLDVQELFARWVAKIKEIGIKEVQGSVIADATIFEENAPPDTWNWNDMGNYYGAGAAGLNINENSVKVIFKPNKIGEPASVIRTEPELPFIQLINHVKTDKAGTGDQVTIFSKPYDRELLLEGFVPFGVGEFAVRGSIPDPAYWLAYSFQKKLLDSKITMCEEPTTVFQIRRKYVDYQPPKSNILDFVYSPSLPEIIKLCNFQSINLYAEALLKTVGVKLGFQNTTSDGVKAQKQVWQSKGISLNGFRPKDGSGLSTVSGITAENMTDILAKMTNEPTFQPFYQSIPVLGQTGTVRNLGRGTRAEGNVHAKSGSIEGVRCYAGYFTSKSGELYCFSFMLNRYNAEAGNATKVLEKLMVMLCDL